MTVTLQPLKAGVIGLGVGEAHVAGYQALENVKVKAICDINPERLDEIGDRYDITLRHTDWRYITEDPDIDVISICSHDDGHAEQAISAFHNSKHCMIEKPVVLHRSEAEELLRAQQESGKLITSNLILRHSPRFIELREQINAGLYGDIAYLEGDYLHDILWKITQGWRGSMEFYCVVYGGGIHLIDLMRWLIGQEVREVTGMSNKVMSEGSDYRFDDLFVNLLRFNKGALAKTTSFYGPKRIKFHSLDVYGTKRTFINGIPEATWYDGDIPENRHIVETPYDAKMKKDGLLADFVEAIREGREPNVSAKDIFRVMDICFACKDSAESGKTVQVNYLI